MQLSQNVQKLKPSATIAVSTLAKKLAAEGRDIINLSAGEPDFDTPDFISGAAVQGIHAGRTRYTPPAGVPELRAAIAARLSERGRTDAVAEGVVVTAGAKQSLFNAIFTLFGPGDDVVIAAPYWTTYPALVELARAEPIIAFGDEARGFKITAEDLEASATENTRGLILNSPCNPSGAVYTLEELREIADWCRSNGVWLISDEIYGHIHHDGDEPAPGILNLDPGELGPYVLVDGASKSFAMTGWRIGFSYSEVELARKMTALQSQITSNAATPSQMAALAAYSDPEAARKARRVMGAAFRRRRDLVCARMRELLPEVPFVEPGGAFYLYFRVDGLFEGDVSNATDWCGRLLEEQGVALVPGAAFGDDRWVRLSFATSDEVLEEALGRIAAMVGA
ncbi:MAG: pyridoxal phosphate-dependent aminotransferase, partial [Longimicrobiales bacterium]|nr:pyridoxal phosphate-dependent aminotransferase [Longimicrobiales bacterium]